MHASDVKTACTIGCSSCDAVHVMMYCSTLHSDNAAAGTHQSSDLQGLNIYSMHMLLCLRRGGRGGGGQKVGKGVVAGLQACSIGAMTLLSFQHQVGMGWSKHEIPEQHP